MEILPTDVKTTKAPDVPRVERDTPTAQYDIAEHWRRPGWKGERINKKHLLFCTGKEESEDSQVQNKES